MMLYPRRTRVFFYQLGRTAFLAYTLGRDPAGTGEGSNQYNSESAATFLSIYTTILQGSKEIEIPSH